MSKGTYGTVDVDGAPVEYHPDPWAPNIVYPHEQALTAARDLYGLVDRLHGLMAALRLADLLTAGEWTGPHRDDFVADLDTLAGESAQVARSLEELSDAIGVQWAGARGQQDRINFARYVHVAEEERKRADEGFQLRDVPEFFGERWGGRKDYGMPPENPPAAVGPAFAPTRSPRYAEYEHWYG